MNTKSLWKYVPPVGPIISLLLIGLVLLSAVLYYHAIKIQRFLEPALALSQPRNEFAKNINALFQKEFGKDGVSGIKIRSNSVFMETSVLFSPNGAPKASAIDSLRRIARIFRSLMTDEHARSEISLVMIIGRYPSNGVTATTAMGRLNVQHLTGIIEDTLFHVEPELARLYAPYFAVSALPATSGPQVTSVEFRIVPSDYLHVEVLEKLEKYSY